VWAQNNADNNYVDGIENGGATFLPQPSNTVQTTTLTNFSIPFSYLGGGEYLNPLVIVIII
jgi:hypothetical protein